MKDSSKKVKSLNMADLYGLHRMKKMYQKMKIMVMKLLKGI